MQWVFVRGAHECDLIHPAPQTAFQPERSGNKPWGGQGTLMLTWRGCKGVGEIEVGVVPVLPWSLLCPAGNGATASHQRRAAHTWAPHTSNTPPGTETRFMFGKEGCNGRRIKKTKQKKGRLKSNQRRILSARKRVYAHRRPHIIPNPSLIILSGPWHSESADTDFPWFGSDPGRIWSLGDVHWTTS